MIRILYSLPRPFRKGSLVLLLLLFHLPAEADFLAETVIGTVESTKQAAEQWQPLKEQMPVNAGEVVRTDFDSLAELLGDDGSFLEVGAATELLIDQFDFAPEEQTRVANLELKEGTVTAEAAHLDLETNEFNVETDTMVAGFKFSKARIHVDSQGNTDVTVYSGKFDFTYKSGASGQARVQHQLPNGDTVEFSLSEDDKVNFQTDPDGEGFECTNLGANRITLNIGGAPINIEVGSRAAMDASGRVTTSPARSPSAPAPAVPAPPATSPGTGTGTAALTRVAGQAASTFQTINRGNTSASAPTITASGTTGTHTTTVGGSTPAQRQEQHRIVRIPVKVVNQ